MLMLLAPIHCCSLAPMMNIGINGANELAPIGAIEVSNNDRQWTLAPMAIAPIVGTNYWRQWTIIGNMTIGANGQGQGQDSLTIGAIGSYD